METVLSSIGYEFDPSRYSPSLGYSRLKVIISGKPTQRFFDVKMLQVPTFDGRFFHQTKVTRHELEPTETFQVCLGELILETYRGEFLRAFSFGGNLRVTIETDDLYCEFSSNAPIFKVHDGEHGVVDRVIVDEIMDLLAEIKVKLDDHENELNSRLSKIEPYPLFLACLVSLQRRVDNIPIALRWERYHKVSSSIKRAIQIVHDTDGWDQQSPDLEELLSTRVV